MRDRSPRDFNQYLRGTCTGAEFVGCAVYISGTPAAGVYPVRRTEPDAIETMPAIGVIIRIVESQCVIQISGVVEGVYSSLVRGTSYQAGYAGAIQATPPLPGITGKAYIQHIGVALSPEALLLRPETCLSVRKTV